MVDRDDLSRVPVEFYIGPRVLSGYLSIASGRRLLDLLNGKGDNDPDAASDYIEFVPDDGRGEEAPKVQYVRKRVIDLAALCEANLARGAGARVSSGVYPRVEKVGVGVTVELPGYFLDGTMHCTLWRTIREVLDEKTLFLPLTDVTIAREGHVCGDRPFVAVRKDQIISLKEENAETSSYRERENIV